MKHLRSCYHVHVNREKQCASDELKSIGVDCMSFILEKEENLVLVCCFLKKWMLLEKLIKIMSHYSWIACKAKKTFSFGLLLQWKNVKFSIWFYWLNSFKFLKNALTWQKHAHVLSQMSNACHDILIDFSSAWLSSDSKFC